MTEIILSGAKTIEVVQRRSDPAKVFVEITCAEKGQADTLYEALTLAARKGSVHVTVPRDTRVRRTKP